MYHTQSAAMKLKRPQQYHGPKDDWDEVAQVLVGEYIFFVFMIILQNKSIHKLKREKNILVFQTLNNTVLL